MLTFCEGSTCTVDASPNRMLPPRWATRTWMLYPRSTAEHTTPSATYEALERSGKS